MSIGILFVVVFALIVLGFIFRDNPQGSRSGKYRQEDLSGSSFIAGSNPDFIDNIDGSSPGHHHIHQHDGNHHSGYDSGSHNWGGDSGGHGGDSSGGGDGGGGD